MYIFRFLFSTYETRYNENICVSVNLVGLLTLKHVKVNACLIDTHYIGIPENVSHLPIG